MDDKLTALRLTVRAILNHDSQTRARMQGRGERVVDQFEVAPLPTELDARHEQPTIADVTNRQSLLGYAAIDFAELSRPIYPQPTGLHVTRHRDRVRTGGIIAEHGDRRRIGSVVLGPETDRDGDAGPRRDWKRVSENIRHEELGRR